MNKRLKQGISMLLGGLLVASNLTLAAPSAVAADPAAAQASAAYMGIDNATKGHWNGKYGTDGYILFGYGATADPGNPIEVDKYTYDVAEKPSYVDPIDGHAYALNDGSRIKVRPLPADETELANILDIPANGSVTKKVEAAVEIGDTAPQIIEGGTAYDNGGRRTLTFHLSDSEEHLFTVYSTKELTYKYFGIQDLEGHDLLPLTKGNDLFGGSGNNSTYVSFRVKGSFKLNYDGQWENIGLQGAFFDPYAPVGLSAQAETDGTVSLAWSNRPGAGAILVERSADGDTYSQIGSLAGNAVQYRDEDTGLVPGQTYSYRLRYRTDGTDSAYTEPAGASVLAPAEEDEARAYLGTDSATSGHWAGKYGGDGYSLVGYDASVAPKVNEWSTIEAATSNDLQSLPAYVDGYAYDPESQVVFSPLTDSDRYYDYIVDMPPGAAVPANPDEVTVGQPRKKYKAWARMNKTVGAYTFNLNDNEEHVFSLYSRSVETVTIELQDLSGKKIDGKSISQDAFTNGAYVSFLVKGSFRIVIHTASQDFGASAFFFDSPLPDRPSSFSAAMLPQRKAQLAWAFADSPDKVILERKQWRGAYAQLAVLNGTVQAYTDTNLTAGAVYSYRIRAVKGTGYGSAAEPQTVQVPAMTPTTLTLDRDEAIHAAVGETVDIGAALQVASPDGVSPVEGAPVTLRLRGAHVGDGVSIGQEIPEAVAEGTTDENGAVQLSFTAEYAGSYTLVAATEPDDARNLANASSDPVVLEVIRQQEQAAPTILKLSDAVMPGKLFTVNGAGLDESAVELALLPAASNSAASIPPAEAIRPNIVQKDRSGLFVVAKMPDDAVPGIYTVWAKNGNGWSAPALINAARPLFISDYEAYEGIDIRLAGRNLDQAEFGGATQTKVRLNNGNGSLSEAAIKQLNPYGITFTVDAANPGAYFVEVSNDGGTHWSRLENGQKLTVVAAGQDPLGLNVAWAKDFNWENEIDVTGSPYGADGSDEEDDTAQVQAAVDAAAADGGVVYFPAGNYYIDQIVIPSGVVLLGASPEQTRLVYTGSGGQNFIDTIAGQPGFTGIPELQGVARLSLRLADSTNRPDSFMWLGEAWGDSVSDMKLRKANRIFVSDVDIDYPTDTDRTTGGRGLGLEFIAKERVLVQNNRFVGWHAQPFITYVSQYVTLQNNAFYYTEGYVVCVSTYAFYIGNHVKVVNQEAHKESHGLFARSNAYIADNVVENVGDTANGYNDGEPIAVEIPNGSFNYGTVLKATPTSVTVAPVKPLVNPKLEFGYLSILIVEGRGMGQLRKVEAIDGYTLSLDRAFDITPDSTSKFTLIAPNDNATIYNNTINNNAKGIWLFGNSIDGVVASNTSVDSEGIFLYSVRNNEGLSPGYYNRIANNTVQGISPRSKHGGIGFNTGRNDNNRAFAIDVYATEFLNNTVSGDNTVAPLSGKTEAPPFGGIYASSASFSSSYDNVPGAGDSTNTIIEGNTLANLGTGVNLTHASYGQVVRGNRYDESVLSFIEDTGSVNTLVLDNGTGETESPTPTPMPTTPPSTSTPAPTATPAANAGHIQATLHEGVAEVDASALKTAAQSGEKTIDIEVQGRRSG